MSHRLNHVYKCLESLTNFLQPALPFINSHMVDFSTKRHWTNFIPEKLRQELEGRSVEDLKQYICDLANGSWSMYESPSENENNTNSNFETVESLNELIIRIGRFSLSSMGITVSPNEVQVNGVAINAKTTCSKFANIELKFDPIMSAKKMHEVELMSEFIVKIANSIHFVDNNSSSNPLPSSETVEYLVDVGSGKGYLSSYLALLHQFKVLAIDSSTINTQGCEKRSANLQRLWSQLLRRAVEKHTLGECSKRGKRWRARAAKAAKNLPEEIDIDIDKKNYVDLNLRSETMFVTQKTDLAESLRKTFELPNNSANSADNCDTLAVVDHTDFGLIGLHTCGNLGVDSLKLFLANDKARFIVNVPCCYHLLDEMENQNGSTVFWNPELGALTSGGITFPISKYLINRNSDTEDPKDFSLGRNARMISSYSLHRMSMNEKDLDLPQSLLYRILLQTLVDKKVGHTLLEYNVGRIGEKCSNFNEYVRKALGKLHLEHKIQVTDAEIEELYESFDDGEKTKLHKYYLLRSIFAHLVEACILLDRLAFLLEQESVKEANIVELFEPCMSPRCHAILAVK